MAALAEAGAPRPPRVATAPIRLAEEPGPAGPLSEPRAARRPVNLDQPQLGGRELLPATRKVLPTAKAQWLRIGSYNKDAEQVSQSCRGSENAKEESTVDGRALKSPNSFGGDSQEQTCESPPSGFKAAVPPPPQQPKPGKQFLRGHVAASVCEAPPLPWNLPTQPLATTTKDNESARQRTVLFSEDAAFLDVASEPRGTDDQGVDPRERGSERSKRLDNKAFSSEEQPAERQAKRYAVAELLLEGVAAGRRQAARGHSKTDREADAGRYSDNFAAAGAGHRRASREKVPQPSQPRVSKQNVLEDIAGSGPSAGPPSSDAVAQRSQLPRVGPLSLLRRAERPDGPGLVARVTSESERPGTDVDVPLTCSVADVLAVARQLKAHVAVAAGDPAGPAEPQLTAPDTASAILVLADPACVDRALPILRQAAGRRVPVLAVLMCQPGPSEPAEVLVAAQRTLCSAGAGDVVLNVGGRATLKANLCMGMARVDLQQAAQAAAERKVMEIARKKLDQERGEPKAGRLFWQVAPQVFPALPALDGAVPDHLEDGLDLGPCVLTGLLGEGGFGCVWAAVAGEPGRREAVKAVEKCSVGSIETVRAICTEIEVLSRLRHPHIVGFYGALHSKAHLFIRMQFAGRHNMCSVLQLAGGRFRLEPAQRFTRQLADAIAYCHAEGVAHRDIKPENVAVSQDGTHITVLDFGSAVRLHEACPDMAGTMPFMAPEVLAAGGRSPYDPSGVDVWAGGVLLLEMLCGYGKLNRMLGWESGVAPKPQRQRELKTFFERPGALEEALQVELGAVHCDLLELLSGMLQVDSSLRSASADLPASPWLQAGEES